MFINGVLREVPKEIWLYYFIFYVNQLTMEQFICNSPDEREQQY